MSLILDVKEKVDLSEEGSLDKYSTSVFMKEYEKIIEEALSVESAAKEDGKAGPSQERESLVFD